jgi:hypothetical protein
MMLHRLKDERGSVATIVAFMIPVFLLLIAMVGDISNWWVHKRHLQMQADSAALAGAQQFEYPCNTTVDSNIAKEADRYAGTSTSLAGTPASFHFNPQLEVHGGEAVLGALNSATFPDGQGQAAGDVEKNTGSACSDGAVDVKLTDKSIPYLFRVGALNHANVHARVVLRKAASVAGALPYGVTDPSPQAAEARVVDNQGANEGNITLTQPKPVDDPYTWTGTGTINVKPTQSSTTPDYSQPAVNIRIAASGNPGPISASCPAAPEECFPHGSLPNGTWGLVQLRAWPTHAVRSTDVAVIYSVSLDPADTSQSECGTDGYFTRIPHLSPAASCQVRLTVLADFNSGVPANKQTVCMFTSTSAYVTTVSGGGACGSGSAVALTSSGTTGGHQRWTGTFPVSDELSTTGPTFISVFAAATGGSVNSNNCNGQPCRTAVIPAQQFFSGAYDYSGYLDQVVVTPVSDYNLAQCSSSCQVTLTVKAHFQPLSPAPSQKDPLFALHLASSQNNQTLDCGTGNTRTQIAQGCSNPFRIWNNAVDTPCDAIASYGAQTSPPISAPPYPCVNAQPGKAVGQIGQGMQDRVLNGSNKCNDLTLRNHWTQYPWSDPNVPRTDHRLVPLFLTRFGAFTGAPNGSSFFTPVTGFALFYVTGWSGQGANDDPCTKATGSLPTGTTVDDNPSTTDTIVGHFVQLVTDFGGPPSDQLCNLGQLMPCVAVLTD